MDRAMAEQIGRAKVSPSETAEPPRRPLATIKAVLRSEAAIILGAITTALFYGFPEVLLSDLLPDLWSLALFLWLFGAMLGGAFGVVRHAECLAAVLGEPFGTLILTLAVISIEVSLISSI